MNKAVTYLTICTAKFAEARGYAQACGGAYLANYTAKATEAQALLVKATDEVRAIYHEPRVDPADIPTVDP